MRGTARTLTTSGAIWEPCSTLSWCADGRAFNTTAQRREMFLAPRWRRWSSDCLPGTCCETLTSSSSRCRISAAHSACCLGLTSLNVNVNVPPAACHRNLGSWPATCLPAHDCFSIISITSSNSALLTVCNACCAAQEFSTGHWPQRVAFCVGHDLTLIVLACKGRDTDRSPLVSTFCVDLTTDITRVQLQGHGQGASAAATKHSHSKRGRALLAMTPSSPAFSVLAAPLRRSQPNGPTHHISSSSSISSTGSPHQQRNTCTTDLRARVRCITARCVRRLCSVTRGVLLSTRRVISS